MNYELAKELKEAGFPQEVIYGSLVYDWKYVDKPELVTLNEGCWSPECECRQVNWPPEDYVKAPTLTELIQACVEIEPTFTLSTTYSPMGWGKNKYEAGNIKVHNFLEGSTLEEAVARLWLALNKK